MGLIVVKNGNENYSWRLPANTGRLQKTFTSRVNASNDPSTFVDTNFIQPGAAEFISLQSQSVRSIGKDEQKFEISVKSNSSRLNVEFLRNSVNASLGGISINNISYVNNSLIDGDPGAEAEFEAIITVNVSVNQVASARSVDVRISDNAGHSVLSTVTQAAQSAMTVVPVETTDAENVPEEGAENACSTFSMEFEAPVNEDVLNEVIYTVNHAADATTLVEANGNVLRICLKVDTSKEPAV